MGRSRCFSTFPARRGGRLARRFVGFFSLVLVIVSALVLACPVLAETAGDVRRQADHSTMDTYREQLVSDGWGSRYAGQVWADKTVFAKGVAETDASSGRTFDGDSLQMTTALDGIDGTEGLSSDFLHVMSVMGSSIKVDGIPAASVVIVIDNSGSMYSSATASPFAAQRVAKTVDAVNRAIDLLMEASRYNEVSVVIFGDGANPNPESASTHCYLGHDTAVTIMPMGHYEPQSNGGSPTPYLKAGWRQTAEAVADGNSLNQNTATRSGNGWIFVDNEICGLTSAKYGEQGFNGCEAKRYTAYANGTTNIHAGIARGYEVLLGADKTVEVGDETYGRKPYLVLLTDGAVTDTTLGVEGGDAWWLDSDLSKDVGGLVNDFSHPGVSFTEHNDSRGTSGDRTNVGWNQFLVAKSDGTYETPASLWRADGRLSFDSYTYSRAAWGPYGAYTDSSGVTKAAGESAAAMRQLSSEFGDAQKAFLLGYLLEASWGKQAVASAYGLGEGETCGVYTVSVDMPNPEDPAFSAGFTSSVGDARMTTNPAMMDPSVGFSREFLSQKGYLTKNGTLYQADTVGAELVDAVAEAVDAWDSWLSGGHVDTVSAHLIRGSQNLYSLGLKSRIRSYAAGKYDLNGAPGRGKSSSWESTNGYAPGGIYPMKDHGSFWIVDENPTVFSFPDRADLEARAAADGVDLDSLSYEYVDGASYVSTTDIASNKILETFEGIVDDISEATFTPVAGTNSVWLDGSFTYMDPIGRYMEVDSVDALTLFGKRYALTEAGIFEQAFEDAHPGYVDGYYDEAGKLVAKEGAGDGGRADCVHRIGRARAEELIPTLASADAATLADTTWVAYAFADAEGAKGLANPCYGHAVEGGAVSATDWAVTFDLADIKVWQQQSAAREAVDNSFVVDSDYDDALYVNVPGDVIPLERVDVAFSPDGTSSYGTNVDDAGEARPLRLIYEVGVADEVLSADGTVDVGKLDAAYVASHKENGRVWFLSNHYSGNTYEGYVHEAARTQGNAACTYSVSPDDRYYRFQSASAIYEAGSSDPLVQPPRLSIGPVSHSMGLSSFADLEAFEAAHPAVGDASAFDADSWYYVLSTYYVDDGAGGVDIMRVAAPRLGSALQASLVWAAEGTDETVPFVPGEAAPTGGGPWMLSCAKGSFKAGDLSQSIGVKGLPIGTSPTSAEDVANVTSTAANYFLPTVAERGDEGVVVDIYLGNDGRLSVADDVLVVAKDKAGDPYPNSPSFDIDVELAGVTGDFPAAKMFRHEDHLDFEFSGAVVFVDSSGWLLAPDGTRYVDGSGLSYRAKATDAFDEALHELHLVGKTASDGHQLFVCTTDIADAYREDAPVGTFDDLVVWETALDADGNGAANAHEGEVWCTASYATETVPFTDGHGRVSLQCGRALAFPGLKRGSAYRVAEDTGAIPRGWSFDSVVAPRGATVSGAEAKGALSSEDYDYVGVLNDVSEPFAPSLVKDFVRYDNGKALPVGDGQFSFAISAVTQGAPMPAEAVASTDGSGEVRWGDIVYHGVGEWDYEVREVNPVDDSVVWDEDAHRLHVSVTESADRALRASWTWDDEAVLGDLPHVKNVWLPPVDMPSTGGGGWPWVALGVALVIVGGTVIAIGRRALFRP